jgi:recombination protein RecR
MTQLPQALIQLIDHLRKLPGVGSKTAEKYAFDLLNWPSDELSNFSSSLSTLKEKVEFCENCHCLIDTKCAFCENPRRNQNIICIIEKPLDIFNFEKTQSFDGVYHALGGLLNPLSFKSEHKLNIDSLLKRITQDTTEVIIALDATLEGEATTLLLKDKLKKDNLVVTRLAYGIPIGSPLNYVDGGTLSRALSLRSQF